MGHEDERWVADTERGAIGIHGPTAHGAGLPAAWVVAVDPVDRGQPASRQSNPDLLPELLGREHGEKSATLLGPTGRLGGPRT